MPEQNSNLQTLRSITQNLAAQAKIERDLRQELVELKAEMKSVLTELKAARDECVPIRDEVVQLKQQLKALRTGTKNAH